MQVDPCGGAPVEERFCGLLGYAGARQGQAGRACARIKTWSQAVDYCNRDHCSDVAPPLPTVKAAQVVCSHDPHKAGARTMIAEIGDGLKRVARPNLRLEPQHLD